jgi:hypothetical protein
MKETTIVLVASCFLQKKINQLHEKQIKVLLAENLRKRKYMTIILSITI